MSRRVQSEAPAPYITASEQDGDAIIAQALRVLEKRLRTPGQALESPAVVRQFLTLKGGALPHEVFSLLLLDNRHCLIEFVELFRGTIDGASVHPREVVKLALHHNAAAVILAHNHPSGNPAPSSADEMITKRLKDGLWLVDIRTLDHIIVAGTATYSFAEHGLL